MVLSLLIATNWEYFFFRPCRWYPPLQPQHADSVPFEEVRSCAGVSSETAISAALEELDGCASSTMANFSTVRNGDIAFIFIPLVPFFPFLSLSNGNGSDFPAGGLIVWMLYGVSNFRDIIRSPVLPKFTRLGRIRAEVVG